jgi:hypothetical protein
MTFGIEWDLLDAEATGHGEARRRVFPDSLANLWLVLYRPSGIRSLRVAVEGVTEQLEKLPSGSGMQLELGSVPGTGQVLELSLSNPNYRDIFDAFIGDIAEAAAGATTTQEVLGLIASRVRRWQRFLREHMEGLSDERQRGLFGELFVLEEAAQEIGPVQAASSWVGPNGASQDFAFGGVAIEVKTSAGKNPQRIRISSERQLDDTLLDTIFLWHVSVDERIGFGRTLPLIIGDLRSLLSGSPGEVTFEDRLIAAGYHDAHADHYTRGYSIRSSDVFGVRDGFPRLTESDCAPGLGDVHYSIELGAIKDYRTEPKSAFEKITIL